ncbi:peptide deformylase [Candidatus Gottesmanbacteria bacterium]|nr:peptide deformylase [Candidatus Gottesmanbacteria bacterium]
MKSIVHVPNAVLTTPAKTVIAFDASLHKLVEEMKTSLRATTKPKGVGLAAAQIGASWRVFITRPKEDDPIRVFINPEIIERSSGVTDGVPERDNKLEGCLSIPEIWGKVQRATHVTLRFQDEHGSFHDEMFTGFMATIIQHETDHTNGILYTHRVIEQKGKLYQTAKDEHGKEVLEEFHVG